MAKTMDPILPILSFWGESFWALLQVQVHIFMFVRAARYTPTAPAVLLPSGGSFVASPGAQLLGLD